MSGAYSGAMANPDHGQPVQLLGVYNADGGVRGELAYVVGHLLGRVECQLCDITHSPVRRKRAWDQFVQEFAIPVAVVHRNEVPAEFAQAVDVERLPAVYARYADGHVDEFVERSELARAAGSVEAFENLLLAKLSG